MKLNIKGVIVPNDYKHVYDYFGIESTSAKDVSDALDAANGQPLEVYINSGGGYVRAGNEIYTPAVGVRRRCEYQDHLCRQCRQHHCHGWAQRNFPGWAADDSQRRQHSRGRLPRHAPRRRRAGNRQRFPRQRLYAQVRENPRRNPRNDGRGNVDYCPARVELGLVDEIMGGDLVAGLGAELLPDSVIQKTLAMFRADKSAELAQAETDLSESSQKGVTKMTREQYNTQRTKLMNDMRAAIDAGDTATANSCRDQVRALDNQWEAEAQARADFAALQNSARSFTPAAVTPAQTNAATQIVNFAAVPQNTPTDPSETPNTAMRSWRMSATVPRFPPICAPALPRC